jgi:Branched-chain amino acid ABC-type transport system, permease components
MITFQAALTGALTGGLYALMAAALSATWGVLRVINLAHFGLILAGAYLTYQVTTSWGLDPILTLVVTVPPLFLAGAALQGAYDRLGVSGFGSLLMSFGLLIIVIQVANNIWTADYRRLDPAVNPYATGGLSIGRVVLPTSTLIAFGFAVVLIGGGYLALQRTFLGRAMRAFAEDRMVAAAFGIDHRRLGLLLGGLGGASAAVAGMIFALSNSITPTTPYEWFGTVFAVVILGGIGNLLGTLVAGIGIGVLSGVVSVVWSPSTEPFFLFLAIILALLLRPQGLFTRQGAR